MMSNHLNHKAFQNSFDATNYLENLRVAKFVNHFPIKQIQLGILFFKRKKKPRYRFPPI